MSAANENVFPTRGGASSADTQMLAQRSPASSVKSQIQLRTTVLHIDNGSHDDDDDDGDEDEDEGEGSTTIRGTTQVDATTHGDSGVTRRGTVDDDGTDDSDDDQAITTINVGHGAWDDSDDDEDGDTPDNTGTRRLLGSSGRRRTRRLQGSTDDHSYLNSLRPTRSILQRWLATLTRSPSAQASLSAPHVTANILSASLNPAVLLSMPAYFDRTGIALGVVGLIVVAALAGAGGGLWVVLGRYVGGSNIEAITAASFGRNTRWKGNVGRALSGLLVALYGTGTAVIAYFALADLLLQVLFHYSPRGIPLHNRLFVTFFVGALITTPLIIYPLAKRNLIRLSTTLALLFYPCTLAILFSYVYKQPQTASPHDPISMPQLNPLHPPSIWAPYSLLPLLSLSSSPLQIIAHNRSLRRTGISGSNVKAFLATQAAQTVTAIGIAVAFGVGVGTQGMGRRLGVEIHPNLFTTLPLTDNLNLARVFFIAILSSHLALCLVTVRSAWARLLFLFKINPFRAQRRATSIDRDAAAHAHEDEHEASTAGSSGQSAVHPHGTVGSTPNAQQRRKKSWIGKKWSRPARDALAGVFLWTLTAFAAYWSGVGGFHLRKGQKNDPDDAVVQANFTRALEVLGLLGAGVGFVLPAFVWIILFHVRQPRAILPPFASEMARQASAWFLGPQSVLAAGRRRLAAASRGGGGGARNADSADAAERQPLLDEEEADERISTDAHPSVEAFRRTAEPEPNDVRGDNALHTVPTWRTETQMKPTGGIAMPRSDSSHSNLQRRSNDGSGGGGRGGGIPEADEATRILLARKERDLQRRTRGRRVYQDIIVLAGILPLGVSLIVLGALDLRHGGW